MRAPIEVKNDTPEENNASSEARQGERKQSNAMAVATKGIAYGALVGAAVGGAIGAFVCFLSIMAHYVEGFTTALNVLRISIAGLCAGAVFGAIPGALLGLLLNLAAHNSSREKQS